MSHVSPELVNMLVCPQTKQKLAVAEDGLVARLNRAVEAGQVLNQGSRTVEDPIEAGLVREDGAVLYPVIDGIPVMLAEESIRLDQLDPSPSAG